MQYWIVSSLRKLWVAIVSNMVSYLFKVSIGWWGGGLLGNISYTNWYVLSMAGVVIGLVVAWEDDTLLL